MIGKIAVEEAWHLPEGTGHAAKYSSAKAAPLLDRQLQDIEGRIAQMDEVGMEMQILSFTSPGVQGITDPVEAEKLAKRSNDYIYQYTKKHPTRLAAFASVSMHDPKAAAAEARRCITEYNFVGVMLNDWQGSGKDGNTMILYDHERFDPFWAEMERLDRPVYMHPRSASPLMHEQLYAVRPWLQASVWGFANQLSHHILAIAASGVFDRFPRLQLHFGHMGEHLCGDLDRADHKLDRSRFPGLKMRKDRLFRDYFESNFMVTTSGHFSTRTMQNVILEIGADRALFAVDYPYEDGLKEGCDWFDRCPISYGDKRKIGRENAIKAYHLEDRLRPNMTCQELGIGGLKGNIYPDEAAHLRTLKE